MFNKIIMTTEMKICQHKLCLITKYIHIRTGYDEKPGNMVFSHAESSHLGLHLSVFIIPPLSTKIKEGLSPSL